MAHGADDLHKVAVHQQKITIAFLVLAWVFISLRVWTRTVVISNFGWDDAAMLVAGVAFSLSCGSLLFIDKNGMGTHVDRSYDFDFLQTLTRWVVVSECAYNMTMMMTKVSVGLFFARIVVERWHFWYIYLTIGAIVLSSLLSFFYSIFRCGPNVPDYTLMQLMNKCATHTLDSFIAYQGAAFNTLTDVAFLILPIIVIWNMHVDRRSKISVGFILMLATMGSICSIIRFQYVEGLTQIDDFFYNAVLVSLWSSIESGTCIMAGCAATLRPLFKHLWAQAGTTNAKSGGSSGLAKLDSNESTKPEKKGSGSWQGTLVGAASEHSLTTVSSDKHRHMDTLAEGHEHSIEMTSRPGHMRGESQDQILAEDMRGLRKGDSMV